MFVPFVMLQEKFSFHIGNYLYSWEDISLRHAVFMVMYVTDKNILHCVHHDTWQFYLMFIFTTVQIQKTTTMKIQITPNHVLRKRLQAYPILKHIELSYLWATECITVD